MHLLIAEDNQDHAELLVETLNDLCSSILVTHKKNGEEALDFLENLLESNAPLPDMVLLDIKMPRMNGTEVLTLLKQHDILKDIPVAMLSTSTDIGETSFCLNKGAVGYISKPLTREDFSSKILPRLRGCGH